jgi:anthranilate phosphoribosyltransferase
VVLLNSAAALIAAGKADTLKQGIKEAENSIDSGKAMEKLVGLAEYTQKNG